MINLFWKHQMLLIALLVFLLSALLSTVLQVINPFPLLATQRIAGLALLWGVAACLSSVFCWWLIVKRPHNYKNIRGVIVGIISAILTHIIFALLFFAQLVIINMYNHISINWSEIFNLAITTVIVTLAEYGLLSLLVGFLAGILLISFWRYLANSIKSINSEVNTKLIP